MGDHRKVVRPMTPREKASLLVAQGWGVGELDNKSEVIVSMHEHLGVKSDLPEEAVEALLGVKSAWRNLERELKRLALVLEVKNDDTRGQPEP